MNAADITARFPELASITITNSSGVDITYVLDDAKVSMWQSAASAYFNVARWGGLYNEGLLHWIAHKYALWVKYQSDTDLNDASDGLNILMPKVGASQNTNTRDLTLAEADNEYLGTKYGQRYFKLSKQAGIGGLSI